MAKAKFVNISYEGYEVLKKMLFPMWHQVNR